MHVTIINAQEKAKSLQINLSWTTILSVFICIFCTMSYALSPRQTITETTGLRGRPGQLSHFSQKVKTVGKFEIFHNTADKPYYFQLKAANGEVILTSQQYTSKQSCTNGIRSVQTNAPFDERYERVNGEIRWSFNLKAANGEVIGRSQEYASSGGRENGIQSVRHNAVTAKIEDMTNE